MSTFVRVFAIRIIYVFYKVFLS